MVIGKGMIARRLAAYQDGDRYIIFASGVSNSNNTEKESCEREQQLLDKTILANPEKKLVYFSTCGIYDVAMQSSVYVQHKLAMEELIKKECSSYCIFRVSNPIGFTNNQHTVLNYFFRHVAGQQPFEVWSNASRNLIDLDDMFALCHYLLANPSQNNSVINIASPVNYAVPNIVTTIEKYLQIKARYTTVNKQSNPLVEVDYLLPIIKLLKIRFEENYLEKMLNKYFPFI